LIRQRWGRGSCFHLSVQFREITSRYYELGYDVLVRHGCSRKVCSTGLELADGNEAAWDKQSWMSRGSESSDWETSCLIRNMQLSESRLTSWSVELRSASRTCIYSKSVRWSLELTPRNARAWVLIEVHAVSGRYWCGRV
jgi:hypothetical protein